MQIIQEIGHVLVITILHHASCQTLCSGWCIYIIQYWFSLPKNSRVRIDPDSGSQWALLTHVWDKADPEIGQARLLDPESGSILIQWKVCYHLHCAQFGRQRALINLSREV